MAESNTMKPKYNINDIVTVSTIGHIYPDFEDAAKQLGTNYNKWYRSGVLHSEEWEYEFKQLKITDEKFKVLSFIIDTYERPNGYKQSDIIYLIERIEAPFEQHLIGQDGLMFFSHYELITEEDFAL